MIIIGSELLVNEDLLETIENGLKKTEYQNFDGRIHASTSGYCPRRGALEATYKGDRDYEAQSALYFEIGIAIEKVILDSLDSQKRLFFRQYHLPETGINLGGKVDGIILHNSKIHCLEIKSCGALPSKPTKEHISQLMIYCAVTGLPGILLYASRHVQDGKGQIKMKMFEFGFDLEACKESLGNAARAFFGSKNGLMPRIPEYITSENDCGFCYFKNICWQGEASDTLEFMSDEESKMVNNATVKFLDTFLTSDELRKRRNGVLKYLSTSGNKTAKFYLDNEDWNGLLLEI